MKKSLSLPLLTGLAFALISWGSVGHKTIATIAENHLTPNAKGAIKALLGNESIADVSSWADQVRNQPEYKQTGPWHYVNVPLGMNNEQFSTAVKAQGVNNVYGALMKCENDLKSATTTYTQKAEALKFIIHFVGDAHQPMHVSRTEDKGGNTIPVKFDGNGMNLHSLWDSGLIDKEGKPFDRMAKDYDTATPAEIKKWQSEPMMQWLWESYKISTKIYADVEKGNKLDDAYYKENMPIVQQRIEMAGIRLAGVLNTLFSSYTPPVNADITVPADAKFIQVASKDIAKHIGDNVTTTGILVSGRVIESNGMMLLNIGGEYPNQDFTIVINKEDRAKFGNPEIDLKGKGIIVHGKVVDYKGKPEIVVSDPAYLQVRMHGQD
jgi:hypothetical protein